MSVEKVMSVRCVIWSIASTERKNKLKKPIGARIIGSPFLQQYPTAMKLLDTNSLFQTVDNVSEALLFGEEISLYEKSDIAKFIISRQVDEAYAGTFAPTEYDSKQDLVLLTGERIKSGAGRYHMIGEEASRILRKLYVQDDKVKAALANSDHGLKTQIEKLLNDPKYSYYEYGMYCCKTCSCALWLNLASGGLGNDKNMLQAGMEYLKGFRENNGKWKGFPVYYLLYVLNEIELQLAIDELNHCMPFVEKRLKRKKQDKTIHDFRRTYICKKIISKINLN